MMNFLPGPRWKKLLTCIRINLLSGLLFLGPLTITWLILLVLVRWFDRIFLFFPPDLRPDAFLPFHIPGLGVILVLFLLFFTGIFVRNYLGNKLILFWEKILFRIPLINTLYKSSKQFVRTLARKREGDFKRVVLVPFPRKGVYALGFVTGTPTGELRDKLDLSVMNIFVPTTPNPTSGYYLLVSRHELIDLDMSVEDAFKLLVSGGLIDPQEQ